MFKATAIITPDSNAFRALDGVADATNFLLIAWLLGVLIIGTKNKTVGGKTWLGVLLAIAGVYLIKTLDSKLHLWESLNLNYSTHTALAAAIVVSLCVLQPSRRLLAVAIFAGYEVLQMLLGFHSLLDIITTLIIIVPLALACLKLTSAKTIESRMD